jgi:outer membrane biosynthesis protein TonB
LPSSRRRSTVSGCTVNTSLLEQELAPLNAQIEQVRGTLRQLESEIRAAETELEDLNVDRQRFDTLRETCNLLDRLDDLEAGQLFWGEVPEIKDPAGHIERMRIHIARFDEEIRVILEKQANLKAQFNQRLDELEYLNGEIHDVHARDERREEEYAIERELSPVSDQLSVMPWNDDNENDRRYRRTLLISLLLSMLLGTIAHLVIVPVPPRPAVIEIPERLAMMVRQEHKKPVPVKKPKEEKKVEKKEEKKPTEKVQEKVQERPKVVQSEPAPAPKKVETTGVLKFKDAFKDLIEETPNPRLGNEARLSNPSTQAAGQAVASRSLVTIQTGGGSSGGIGNAAVSRNVGVGGGGNSARLGRGGSGFAHVKSEIGGAGGKEGRPLSSGARPARTDEEIQILFDRYKAALYRIYNTELRNDPTLRGKMVLRITIEPDGVVSACKVESCNMNAPEFSDQIVARVRKFNFGPKDGVPTTTILYPIDFLPAR